MFRVIRRQTALRPLPLPSRVVSQPVRLQSGFDSVQDSPSIFSRLLNHVPKGFKKYFPEGKSGTKQKTAAEEKPSTSGTKAETGPKGENPQGGAKKEGPKKDNPKKGNSSGGGNNGLDQDAARVALLICLTIGITGIGYLTDKDPSVKEISWQDFRNNVLPTKEVEKILINDQNIARVVVKARSSAAPLPMIIDGDISSKHEEDVRVNDSYSEPFQDTSGAAGAATAVGSISPDSYRSRYTSPGPPGVVAYQFMIGSVDSFEKKMDEAQKELGFAPTQMVPVVYVTETDYLKPLLGILPTVALIGLWLFMMRSSSGGAGGGGMSKFFQITKSPAKKIQQEKVTTRFKDVAGCNEAKNEIMEFVEFLRDSKKFTDLGAKIPKGALLVGPPGTGKTMLARAVAGEANVPFYSVSGSDFIEMFVGLGSSRVRDLFKEARQNSPSIIFIDEIDAIGRKRGGRGEGGGNDERESTLNQLLVEMDGFDNTSTVVVLASTNRADILDKALTRPGRFDRQVTVEKPDIAGRKEVFEVHLKGLTLNADITTFSSRLAALTPGFSGADIANICNEAAIIAARSDKKFVEYADFEKATDRVIGGLESKKIMSPDEKRIVAYHEAGHAIAGWYLQHADPLLKVTIVPRGNGALGFAQYLPKELFLRSKDQLMDMVCMALAGRASEQMKFGRVTTGAADDLRRVTQIVYQMVQVYGMNESIGQVAFPRDDSGYPQEKAYSNSTAEMMDLEVRKLVDEAYKRTLALVEEKKAQIEIVAEYLMEKETISNADVTRLIGAREFSPGEEYIQYVEAGRGWNKEADSDPEAIQAAEAIAEMGSQSEPDAESDNDENGADKTKETFADVSVEADEESKSDKAKSSPTPSV